MSAAASPSITIVRFQRPQQKEFINGKWVTIDADFAKYDSFEQSIMAHAGFFIRNKRYANTKSLNG